MSPTTAQAQPLPLHEATFSAMLCATVDALPHHPRATAEQVATVREAALLFIASLRPRDPMEASLAARIVALDRHVMWNLACAAHPGVAADLQMRAQGRAGTLGRLLDLTRAEYRRLQADAPCQPAGLPTWVAPGAAWAAASAAEAEAAPSPTPVEAAQMKTAATPDGEPRAAEMAEAAPAAQPPVPAAECAVPVAEGAAPAALSAGTPAPQLVRAPVAPPRQGSTKAERRAWRAQRAAEAAARRRAGPSALAACWGRGPYTP